MKNKNSNGLQNKKQNIVRRTLVNLLKYGTNAISIGLERDEMGFIPFHQLTARYPEFYPHHFDNSMPPKEKIYQTLATDDRFEISYVPHPEKIRIRYAYFDKIQNLNFGPQNNSEIRISWNCNQFERRLNEDYKLVEYLFEMFQASATTVYFTEFRLGSFIEPDGIQRFRKRFGYDALYTFSNKKEKFINK